MSIHPIHYKIQLGTNLCWCMYGIMSKVAFDIA